MNRTEFEQLRALPEKLIVADIVFTAKKDVGSDTLVFDQVEVQNALGWDVVLNGTYKPNIPSVTFNFVIRGVGPICRICINGAMHGDAGRTHKHDLRTEHDPRLNLPIATGRPDLDITKTTVSEIWQTVCDQANIRHTGVLKDPNGGNS